MASPTNLTDRLAHLREKSGSPDQNPQRKLPRDKVQGNGIEGKWAADYFTISVYALIGAAGLGQLILIVALDVF